MSNRETRLPFLFKGHPVLLYIFVIAAGAIAIQRSVAGKRDYEAEHTRLDFKLDPECVKENGYSEQGVRFSEENCRRIYYRTRKDGSPPKYNY